jgi:23S rRNA pseudouridine2605 synthase
MPDKKRSERAEAVTSGRTESGRRKNEAGRTPGTRLRRHADPDFKGRGSTGSGKYRRSDPGKSGRIESAKTERSGRGQEIRLNRYIANAGICSRREADQFIQAGLVSVNGKVVDRLGTKVNPGDKVSFNGKSLRDEKKVYILMNKPKDCVTTVEDPGAKFTVMDILGKKFAERVYPVGRLDRDTTGVLLLTNDGDLTQRLTHPSYHKKKIYHVFLDKDLTHADLVRISKGVNLDDGFIRPDAVHYADKTDKSQVGIELHSGKNRIVKRIFESAGYRIIKLDRVFFAGLTKKGLNRGQWRFLTDKEIRMLKMDAYE